MLFGPEQEQEQEQELEQEREQEQEQERRCHNRIECAVDLEFNKIVMSG